ncbi:MAG TPA: aromatic ring-hydroxylating dioxygenase subunit alpha [Steroidobacteraceae bacterium]|nr:aromatic ring-hydroxylating dioxygenase subunit alpha [Steroidobacteraceae bacterium]
MAFLRNAWYAAGWSESFTEQLSTRQIIGEDLLIYRMSSGIRAMSDTCPHRFAPLHLGKRIGDEVQCAYHGLRFGPDGKCVHNPHGNGRIPSRVRLRTYPAAERYQLLWIWMGEPGLADATAIPDFSFMDDLAFSIIKGEIVGDGAYELYTDNILDLGHAEFLHTGLAAAAFTLGARNIAQEGATLFSTVTHPNDFPSEVVQFMLKKPNQRMNYWGDSRWNAPATMAFDSYLSEPGQPKPLRPSIPTLHIFTPESEATTRYFWAVGRANDIDDLEHSERLRAGFVHAFENEDKPMISAQFQRLKGRDFWDMKPLLLPTDAGAVKARRILAKLIEDEWANSVPLPDQVATRITNDLEEFGGHDA